MEDAIRKFEAPLLGREKPLHLARLEHFVGGFPTAAAIGVLLLAILGGAGWLLEKASIGSFIPGMPTMKVATSVMLTLQGLSLLAIRDRFRFQILILALNLPTLVGAGYFLLNPIDRPDTPVVLLAPSQATSLTLGLLAFSQLLRLAPFNARLIAITLVFSSLLPLHRLTTFIVGHGTLQTTGPFDSMSLPTSLALYLLAGGLFLNRELPYAGQLVANTLQGRVLRLTTPWTLFAPPVLAVLITLGAYSQLYNIEFVVATITAALSAVMTVMLWVLTVKLQNIDNLRAAVYHDLSLSEKYANQLIEASQDAMMAVDRSGHILRANAQSEKLFGYSRSQLAQMSINELLPERFRADHDKHMQRYFGQPKARYMGGNRELPALRKDGTEVPVEIALNPVDSVYGSIVLANIIDITDHLQKEVELRASLEEKTLLLNEVHHRVKNNLQIVASLLHLQAGAVQDPGFNRLIAESEGRVRAMALLHQILYERKDFAHVELDVYLQRLAELQMQIHRSNGRRVQLQLDCDHLRMDLSQSIPLGQIVNELLSNAFKHAFNDTRNGELQVTLKAEGGDRARLVVRDNGPGWHPEAEDNEPRGLGTQLIQLLSEQIGAELKYGSPPGGRIELTIPVLADENTEQISSATA